MDMNRGKKVKTLKKQEMEWYLYKTHGVCSLALNQSQAPNFLQTWGPYI
jgi:hypothetical protein